MNGGTVAWEDRPYQREAIAACVAAFAEGAPSVMLESPVGSGKTFMALEVARLLEERAGRPLRVAWVAPRRRLLEQVMEANRDLHRLTVRPVSLFEKNPPEADLAVLDEAHHEATRSCVALYEKIKAPLALGLSATPMRTDRMKLSFRRTVATCGIDRLVREGWLSPVHSYLLPHWGPRIAAECYLSEPARWGKTLAFFRTIDQCREFRDALEAGGVRCEVVTGSSDKDEQLAAFEEGAVRVVANVLMLAEGFDQPDVQSVFARDASRVPTIQMCGRGLRLAPGKDHCNIVQSTGTRCLFERVTPPLRTFRLHGGRWLSLQDKTEEVERTLRESLELLEAREASRKARGRGGWRGGEDRPRAPGAGRPERGRTVWARPAARAWGAVPEEVLARYRPAYRAAYDIFDLCNRLGWNGTLPPCRMGFGYGCGNRNRRGVVLAYVRSDGRDRTLVLNLDPLAFATTGAMMPVLFHEMTHLWQFATGRCGRHDAAFRAELRRVGVDEMTGQLAPGSAVVRAMIEVDRLFPWLAGWLRRHVGAVPQRQGTMEECFFREHLASVEQERGGGGI